MAMGLGDVPGIFLSLVFIVTVGVAGYLILAGLNSATTDNSATGAIGNFTTAMDNIVTYAPTFYQESFLSHSDRSRGGIGGRCGTHRYCSDSVQVWAKLPIGVT